MVPAKPKWNFQIRRVVGFFRAECPFRVRATPFGQIARKTRGCALAALTRKSCSVRAGGASRLRRAQRRCELTARPPVPSVGRTWEGIPAWEAFIQPYVSKCHVSECRGHTRGCYPGAIVCCPSPMEPAGHGFAHAVVCGVVLRSVSTLESPHPRSAVPFLPARIQVETYHSKLRVVVAPMTHGSTVAGGHSTWRDAWSSAAISTTTTSGNDGCILTYSLSYLRSPVLLA
jgi:hypothetical protein